MVHESEFIIKGRFMQINYEPTEVRDAQVRQLIQTLGLLPFEHLRVIPIITVGDRPPRGGGGSAHRGMSGGPYIRLNKTCFRSPWNLGAYNETLLHECGHVVDWAFSCMTNMRREDRSGYDALLRQTHHGATQHPGEHYADAYARFYLGRRMPEICRNAFLNSRAFSPLMC